MPSCRRPREGSEDDIDEDEENQYGIRRSRRATSIAYRDSSSLSPAQIMEQEVYYASAEEAISRSLHISQLLCLLVTSYHHLSTMVNNWLRLRVSNGMAHAISLARDKMHHLKIGIDRLFFSDELGKSIWRDGASLCRGPFDLCSSKKSFPTKALSTDR